jgi:hypothetical protein
MFYSQAHMFIKFYSGISDHIISKTRCVCGKKNVLADDLLPNKTLRHTINRILEGANSSSETAGSTFAVRGSCFTNMAFIVIITMCYYTFY